MAGGHTGEIGIKRFFWILLSSVVASACYHNKKEKFAQKPAQNQETTVSDSLVHLQKLTITGDFDGDGKSDTICQNTISKSTREEITSFPENQWDSIERYFDRLEADVTLTLKNRKADTLHLGSGGGMYCLINIGDTNKDRKDEVAFVVDYYNFSNISPCMVYTLCDGEWIQLQSFKIHESAFEYEGEKLPVFKEIKGFLEVRNKRWHYIDYQHWFDAETDSDTLLKPLENKTTCG